MVARSKNVARATKIPPKVEQPHGGSIYQGGVPGNRGGGRLPAELRQIARDDLDEVLPTLKALIKRRTTKDVDKIRAIDVLAHVGLSETINRADVTAALRGTEQDIREFLSKTLAPEQIDALMSIIVKRWLAV